MAATKIKDIGISTAIGDRQHQEGRYIVCKPGALSHTDYALFAVCDGHAGATASDHISQHLPRHIDIGLNDASFDKSPEEVIQDAIRAEDDALRDLGCLSTGSTLALALVDTKKNVLTTADLGDSHILLGQIERDGTHKTNRISRLSEAQKPHDREERHRIQRAGGVINHGTAVDAHDRWGGRGA